MTVALGFYPDALHSLFRPCDGAIVQGEVNDVRNYETMYVLRPELEQEKVAEMVGRFQTVVTEQGGQVTELKEMGRRRLAYEIDGAREGFYVLMKYDADTNVTAELERVFRITDGVLRYLTVREDQ